MTIALIILTAICLHRVIILILIAVPKCIITQIQKKYDGELPKGNRFANYFDDILLYWISQIHSHHIRMFYYKNIFGANLAKNVVIYKGCEIRNPLKLIIEEGSIIGDDAILDAREGIHIGKNVNLSSHVHIWTLQHDYRDKDFLCNKEHYGHVTIADRVWLGPRTTILPMTNIGEGAVIAAGCVVTNDVLPFSVMGGIPARQIGERPKDISYNFNGSHRHFL